MYGLEREIMEIFTAETAFTIGAECHGWNDQGDIEIVLTADRTGIEFLNVKGNDGEPWFYPLRNISADFLAFLQGKGYAEVYQNGYILTRCNCCGVVSIRQE
jgi:hypothetical protein